MGSPFGLELLLCRQKLPCRATDDLQNVGHRDLAEALRRRNEEIFQVNSILSLLLT